MRSGFNIIQRRGRNAPRHPLEEEESPVSNPVVPAWADALENAETELASVVEQAMDDGYPVPPQDQIEQAGYLLREMFAMARGDYSVYPTPDAEIAIDLTNDDISIIVFIHRDGAAGCFVDTDHSQEQRLVS